MKKMLLTLAATMVAAGSVWAENGKIDREYWESHSGGLNGVKKNIAEAKAPTGSDTLVAFEAVSWKDSKKKANFADKYGQRVFGFLIPEKSGEYIFWVAADDSAELMLSTDENPANAKRIAHTSTWTSPRQWTKKPSQKSAPVKLEAGKKYYIEAIMIEGGGGDNLAVAWAEKADDAKPQVIDGKFLSTAPKGTPSAYAKKK
ncbi:MAG: hypothetical protein JXR78_07370 [Victivallales bacterium]|nr:hypothetical protein [Victivallales bacterium]